MRMNEHLFENQEAAADHPHDLEGWFFVELNRQLRLRMEPGKADEIEAELRDHLSASIDAYQELGACRHEAGELAVRALGAPAKIASLSGKNKTAAVKATVWIWTACMALSCLAFCFGTSEVYMIFGLVAVGCSALAVIPALVLPKLELRRWLALTAVSAALAYILFGFCFIDLRGGVGSRAIMETSVEQMEGLLARSREDTDERFSERLARERLSHELARAREALRHPWNAWGAENGPQIVGLAALIGLAGHVFGVVLGSTARRLRHSRPGSRWRRS